jgi:hypothetical protein
MTVGESIMHDLIRPMLLPVLKKKVRPTLIKKMRNGGEEDVQVKEPFPTAVATRKKKAMKNKKSGGS